MHILTARGKNAPECAYHVIISLARSLLLFLIYIISGPQPFLEDTVKLNRESVHNVCTLQAGVPGDTDTRVSLERSRLRNY